MKRPELCLLSKVEICENCQHWEPIPFHHRGGECIPRVEVPVVRLVPLVSMREPERVPVKV